MRPPVCISLIVLGGGLGFFAGYALTPSPETARGSASRVGATAAAGPTAPLTATIDGSLEGSSMVAEWERLNATEVGGNDFGGLFTRIKATEDPFRRRAFRAAAIADWVARDPVNTYLHLRGKDKTMATQFVREWFRTNPNAAIDQLLSDGAASRSDLSGLLEDIAKLAPGRLAEIFAKNPAPAVNPNNPQSSSSGTLNAERAFTIFAGQDLDAARAAAETLSGTMRDKAMAGIGGAWAEKDGVAALAWAESLPPGAGRNAVLQRVLAGWAKADPFAALGKLDLLPKEDLNNNRGGSQISAAVQVLAEASKKDWYGTMAWLEANPGKIGGNAFYGLNAAFARRLRDDPIPMMRDVVAGDVPGLGNVFAAAISGEGYAQRDAIWAWLKDQPKSPATDLLRGSVLSAVAYKDPSVALELLRTLPESDANQGYYASVASNMFNNNGGGSANLEEWYEKAPPGMRPYLLRYGLGNDPQSVGANAARWAERLDEVPKNLRNEVVGSLANGWANHDPVAAGKWALSLADPTERAQAFGTVANFWAYTDNEQFAQVLETLPKGSDRDLGTQSLAQALMQSYPEAAWDWAAEIQDEARRLQALQMVYSTYASRNRAAADELVKSANLTEVQRQQFQPGQRNQQNQNLQRYLQQLESGSTYRSFDRDFQIQTFR